MGYEWVREKLAEHLYKKYLMPWRRGLHLALPWEEAKNHPELKNAVEVSYKDAEQILSLDGIEIRADDQSLPAYCYNSISRCVNDMLKPDSEGRVWVRVIPKPKRK